jgi:hypothetical protein
MKNRFSNRETLNFQQVGGFDPTGGSVRPSSVTSAKSITSPTPGAKGMSGIEAIMNPLLTGEGLEVSSNILRSLDLAKS